MTGPRRSAAARLLRLVRGLVLTGLIVGVLTAAAVQVMSWRVLAAHENGKAIAEPVDAIIVLGASVYPNHTLGPSSERRVAAAAEAWRAGRGKVLIMSGGTGLDHPDYSAGAMMRDHAVSLGVPAEAVLVEGRSVSTFENIRFSFEIASGAGLRAAGAGLGCLSPDPGAAAGGLLRPFRHRAGRRRRRGCRTARGPALDRDAGDDGVVAQSSGRSRAGSCWTVWATRRPSGSS